VTYPARQEELQIPFLGAIAAGNPIPAPPVDSWDIARSAEQVGVPRYLVAGFQGVFALKVKGDSMQDALIGDGDTILLQATEHVENGQTAAVWLEDRQEVTLKKVYRDGSRVRLQPANKRYAPILTSASNVRIQGRLVAVMRSFGH
jgi:repressor LexA